MKTIFSRSVYAFALCLFSSGIGAEDKGNDFFTKSFWNIEKTFRADFRIDNIVDENSQCGASGGYSVGKGSVFGEEDHDEKAKEMIISFDFIKDDGGANLPDLNTPYKLCTDHVKGYKYRRVGGVDTGVLVVPFKIRDGDIFGDATLGPYFAFKGNNISLLATFGLTQIGVSDVGESDVSSETGLSAAVGLVWSLTKIFDIGLVVGKDHLSGNAGDNFKYQDDTWWSFSIGYNFTSE